MKEEVCWSDPIWFYRGNVLLATVDFRCAMIPRFLGRNWYHFFYIYFLKVWFDQSWFVWSKACTEVMKLFNPNPMLWVMSWPRHTFTTRWLFTGISSHLYYGDWTLDDLLAELTRQAIDAFESGICDPWCVPKKKSQMSHLTLKVGVGCFRVSMCPFHLALASQDINGSRLRLVCIGTKGDWVFLRKAP